MKKNIGNALALYPTPLVVVGAMVNGKPNWLLVGHLGIMGHDHVMVSLAKSHYTNQGIKESRKLSINIVDEALLAKADRSGCASGSKEDKSELFDFIFADGGAPMISQAPVVMECSVEDIYETKGFDNFICTIDNSRFFSQTENIPQHLHLMGPIPESGYIRHCCEAYKG